VRAPKIAPPLSGTTGRTVIEAAVSPRETTSAPQPTDHLRSLKDPSAARRHTIGPYPRLPKSSLPIARSVLPPAFGPNPTPHAAISHPRRAVSGTDEVENTHNTDGAPGGRESTRLADIAAEISTHNGGIRNPTAAK